MTAVWAPGGKHFMGLSVSPRRCPLAAAKAKIGRPEQGNLQLLGQVWLPPISLCCVRIFFYIFILFYFIKRKF